MPKIPESLTVFGKVFKDPADIKALWAAWSDEQREEYRESIDRERLWKLQGDILGACHE